MAAERAVDHGLAFTNTFAKLADEDEFGSAGGADTDYDSAEVFDRTGTMRYSNYRQRQGSIGAGVVDCH